MLDVDADRDRVWRSLVDPLELSGWWSTRLEADASEVGRARFTFAGDLNPVMEIAAIDAPRRLAWRCTEGHPNRQDNTSTFEPVAPDDDRCRLRFIRDYAVELSEDDNVYNVN